MTDKMREAFEAWLEQDGRFALAKRETIGAMWQAWQDAQRQGGEAIEPTPDMIEAAAQRLVRWEDGCTWPDSWDALTVAAARQDAERALRSGLQVMPDDNTRVISNLESDLQLANYRRRKCCEALERIESAINKATFDYARGRDIHEIFKELKDVERDCS